MNTDKHGWFQLAQGLNMAQSPHVFSPYPRISVTIRG